MQRWSLKLFAENNKKLKNYLNNIDNAIVLLSVNDKSAVQGLKDYLCREYGFDLMDYQFCQNGLVMQMNELAESGENNRICLFNMDYQQEGYDIIKTINLSRDIFREVGIVVLIMPVFMADRVKRETPNLYDYITLCLDYNIDYPLPFTPIYSEDDRFFLPKFIVTARKRQVLSNNPKEIKSMKDYYRYLEKYRYVKMDEKDVKDVINWLFFNLLEELQDKLGKDGDINDLRNLRMKLYKQTAEVFVRQHFFDRALEIYDELLYVARQEKNISVYFLEAYQGQAYCQYCKGEYEKSKKILRDLYNMLEKYQNIPWKYKVYSDYAACLFQMGQLDDAFGIWEVCEMELKKVDAYVLHRHFRILYNKILCEFTMKKWIGITGKEWEQFEIEIGDKIGTDSKIYFDYMVLNSWILLVQGDFEKAGRTAEIADAIGMVILPENDRQLMVISYIRSLIYLQMGKEEESQRYENRGRNILKNHTDVNGKLLFFGEDNRRK